MKTGIFYHSDFAEKGYVTLRHRVKPGFDALRGLIQTAGVEVFTPRVDEETRRLLAAIHSPGHIERVKEQGYHDVALLSAAGVIEAAGRLTRGELDFAFCFVGTAGHHASYGDCWGFCYYNDVAMAVKKLREDGIQRVMIIDIDPHFGDGTRFLLGIDPEVIHINFHDDDVSTSEDPRLNNYDYGLEYVTDQDFLNALDHVLGREWEFEFLIIIFGHDSHTLDYGDFYLSSAAYPAIARRIKEFAGSKPILTVLSGGSNPQVAAEVIPQFIGACHQTY